MRLLAPPVTHTTKPRHGGIIYVTSKDKKHGVIESKKSQRRRKIEMDKWKSTSSTLNTNTGSDELLQSWYERADDITLDDDADITDILDLMEGIFDDQEKETLKMMHKGRRIAYPKQLGDWITLSIDGENNKIYCNCSRCNSHGICNWVAAMEVIQFGVIPPADCRLPDEGFGWKTKVVRATRAMKEANIDFKDSDYRGTD